MTIQPYLGYDSPVNFNGELVRPKWLPDPVCPIRCARAVASVVIAISA